MTVQPNPCWQLVVGLLSEERIVNMMTFEHLQKVADEWAETIPDSLPKDGPVAILRTSRSHFAHSWFDYEFMVVAALVAFQALGAAFHVLNPDAKNEVPFWKLVQRTRKEGDLEPVFADLAELAVEVRNLLSHPQAVAAFSVGIAAPMLEQSHRLVALVLATAQSKNGGNGREMNDEGSN